MTPERWQQINDLFQAAVDLAPGRRSAFLDEACTTDKMLRTEVESLLASDEHDWKLIDIPALEVAAPFMADDQPRLAPSQHLGHYEILSLLGKGGMGEVYLAKDEVLNRSVALKLLPTDYTRDKDRPRRFQQEARAVSALNHPNILTIHELGEVVGQQFIATEFVDGETLRQRMKRVRLSLPEALDVAIQVTGALTAAHQARIVHRDIKPENIMLRPDGYVKVLDFGLAKLSEQREPALNARADSLDVSSDLVMGTIKYMSPEQARGLTVDPRSDIFSVGIVLYEMLTGRAPFKGETPGDLIESIVRNEPPSLETYLTGAPAKLEDVIRKTLSKERAQRYQTAEDLSLDLKYLKEELEHESKLKRAARPSSTSGATAIAGDTLMPAATAISTGDLSAGSTASTAETFATRITRRKTSAALFLVFALGAVGLVYALIKWTAARRESFGAMKMTKLPNPGGFSGVIGSLQNKYARISPDGKYLARVLDEGGSQSLWVQELETNSSTQIVPPAAVEYNELLFSPDGKDIYYIAYDNKSSPALYHVAAVGGAANKVIDDVNFNATLSPDGRRFAFVRREEGGDRFLMVGNVDGTGVRKIASRSGADTYGPLAWSPDGRGVACACRSFTKTSPHKLIEILVADGSERPISPQEWGEINDLAWLADGSGLIIAATEPAAVFHQIWEVSYPGGEARRITNDPDDYSGISLASNSTKLVTVRQDWSFDIWVAQVPESGDAKKVTLSKEDGYNGLSWTPDGRIVYASSANGNTDIWIMDADGSHRKQLTLASGQNNMPHVSADGRFIVFVSNRSGTQSIWRMDVDGTYPKQLTTGSADVFPQITSDGLWVIYQAFTTNTNTIWKVSIDGGAQMQVIESLSHQPAISPDRKFLAYQVSRTKVAVKRLSNSGLTEGDTTGEFDILAHEYNYQWSRDGRALTYIVDQNDVSNVWSQPIDGQPATQLTYFKSDHIAWFDWAPDGKHIALARGNVIRDVVLISNFK